MTIDLSELYRSVFGVDKPATMTIAEQNNIIQRSMAENGQPYFDMDDQGREFFMPVRLDGKLIPFAVVSQIKLKRNIVETALSDREFNQQFGEGIYYGGDVIEMIGFSSPAFSIKGFLINEDNNFPEQETISMQRMWQKYTSLKLRSVLTDIFLSGVFEHNVIVHSIDWKMTPGVQHAIAFNMEVKADMIFDLEMD